MKVAVLLAEGFETIEALTTVDILRRAGVTCNTIGTKSLEVTTSHSITIKADKVLNEEVYDYDAVVLPGGMPGAVNLRDDEKVNELVKKFYDEGKIVAAICAGSGKRNPPRRSGFWGNIRHPTPPLTGNGGYWKH